MPGVQAMIRPNKPALRQVTHQEYLDTVMERIDAKVFRDCACSLTLSQMVVVRNEVNHMLEELEKLNP